VKQITQTAPANAQASRTNQPTWKLVENLGDRNPIEHGGYFVYEDATGVYAPEAELVISPDTDSGKWEVRRFILEPCTFINGILSDNKFHPQHPAWFADSIGSISNFIGTPLAELIDMLCNGNIVNRAMAWRAIGEYHGFDNLDSYPLYFNRAEIEARLSK
jgi:hypothetical protein